MNSSISEQKSRVYSEQELVSDLDPMLEGGAYKVAFQHNCPFEIRQIDSEGQQIGKRDMLRLRILVSPSIETYTELKLQLSCEEDLFFMYECRLDQRKFERIRKTQSLNFKFPALLQMLIKLLSLCDKVPEQYNSLIVLGKANQQRFTILENIEYKRIELMTLELEDTEQETKKQCLAFRFSLLKSKNLRIDEKIKEMLGMVKVKSLTLYQHIVKNGSGALGMGSRLNRTYQH